MTEAIRITKDVIGELLGKELIPLLDIFKDKKDINEFNLAEKLKINVNQLRNMLYKLSSYSLVTSTRKKDKKKGWYVYYWSLNMPKIREKILSFKSSKLKELNKQIGEERINKYFSCPTKCVRLKYNEALEIEFRCPECGSILQEQDNKSLINKLNQEIKTIEDDIEYIKNAEKEFAVKKIVEKKSRKKIKKPKKKVKKLKKKKPIKKKKKKSKPIKIKKQKSIRKIIKKKRIIKSPKKLIKKFGKLFI